MSENTPSSSPLHKDRTIFQILWKLFAIGIITVSGAAITCGGNIILSYVGLRGGQLFLIILWGIEIFIIFIWTIWKFFFQTTTWNSQTKAMKIIIILIPLLGIISYIFIGESLSGI